MLTCQKHLFSLPAPVSYLNCAYMSPQMKVVEKIGQEMLVLKTTPYQIQPSDFFTTVEALKAAFSRLIGAADPQRVAVIPSASYGLSTAALNVVLQPGQNIVVTAEQFPSNYYPWEKLARHNGAQLKVTAPPPTGPRATAWNQAILEAIDEHTALVAIGQVHWTDGTPFDLPAIRKRSREVGALLIIDGTQSVGALPLDVATVQPDALVCAGYKFLMGPYSIGLAYFGPHFDEGEPIEENWINRLDSQDFKNLVQYQPAYQAGAGRYSVGEQSNFLLTPMLLTAVQQLLEWQPAAIQAYCKKISQAAVEKLSEMGAVLESEHWRCGHLFGIRLNEHFDEAKLESALKSRQVYISRRGNAVRVAPHVYNDEEDLWKLVSCFEAARKKAHHPVPTL